MELRDLQRMTVVKLREEALKLGGVSGVHGMNKQQIIEAMAPQLGIDLEAASKAAREKFAADKPAMKREIVELKAQRDEALAEHEMATVAATRKRIKRYKRKLRRLAKEARASV